SVMVTSASGIAARINASISAAGIAMVSGLAHQLAAGFDAHFLKSSAHTGFVDLDVCCGEIAQHLADNVLVTGFLEVRLDDSLAVRLGFFRRQAHLFRSPLAQQAVTPRSNTESGIRVHRELRFLGAPAIVEVCHVPNLSNPNRPRRSRKRVDLLSRTLR